MMRIDPDLQDDAQRDADPLLVDGIAAPGYRLPAALRLGHVALQVADLETSLTYYQDVLGLHIVERAASTATLGTQHGGAALVHLAERPGANHSAQHSRLGLYHFAILLPNRAALGRFVSHLGDIGAHAGASDHLVSEALYLRDPDGLGIEVYADRPRSAWARDARQIRMSSDPLDLGDLVRAAGGEPWDGMPAGTVMGHVHLHVGNLEEAAAFYHSALGLDKMVWSYPSALFLAAGGYHHHLGINTWAGPRAPVPTDADARLLEWRMVLPSPHDVQRAAASLSAAGYPVVADGNDCIATDPWGTRVRLLV